MFLNSYQIFYLHGFESSSGSLSAKRLVRDTRIEIIELDYHSYHPYEQNFKSLCAQIQGRLDKNKKLIFSGTSLGGFYAGMLGAYYKTANILFNPVVLPQKDALNVLKIKSHSIHKNLEDIIFSYPNSLELSRLPHLVFQAASDEVLEFGTREEFFTHHKNVEFIAIEGGHIIEDFTSFKKRIWDFLRYFLER